MSFRTNISSLRMSHNMTQEQLAMLVGVSRQSVTKWEAGKASPDMDKLLKLCDIFQVSLDELVKSDLSDREPVPTAQISIDTSDDPVDITGYDTHWRRFAAHISTAASAVPLGLAVGFTLSGTQEILDKQPLFLLGPLFLSIVICVYCGVLGGSEHADFKREHPFVQDFYTSEDRKESRRVFVREICLGILLIFTGICLVIYTGDNDVLLYPVSAFMFCLGLAIQRFVWGSLLYERMRSITAWDSEQEEQATVQVGTHKLPVRAITEIIMAVATILALISLFVPGVLNSSAFPFWLYWVIGGIISGVIEIIFRDSRG